jgi:3-deoxy-7-phosphoheptulonate synthase
MEPVTDLRIESFQPLPTPGELLAELPRTDSQAAVIQQGREDIHRIIHGQDPRLLVVVGPCSIHCADAGREYAEKLAALAEDLNDRLLLVMRVYFEKPRTTTGWKGLIMDPDLNGAYNIPEGLRQARRFLGVVLDLGLPTATELLDPITPQYIADSLCYAAIGARTVESQTHRQMASGLSMPVGMKNATSGEFQTAVNAIVAASQRQTFLGVTSGGQAAAVTTKGNPDTQLILRGGANGPNYDAKKVDKSTAMLQTSQLPVSVMVDCSHGNSGKDPKRQPHVLRDVLDQIQAGNRALHAVMIESNLKGGNQPFPAPLAELEYGVSITDGCLDWESTEKILRQAHEAMVARRD